VSLKHGRRRDVERRVRRQEPRRGGHVGRVRRVPALLLAESSSRTVGGTLSRFAQGKELKVKWRNDMFIILYFASFI
jgi:hypothetical protein